MSIKRPGLWIPKVLEAVRSPSRFTGSSSYWEVRYERGGTSGPGSYGELALFKAEFLNALVSERGVTSVCEFGCGDGHQLSLAHYPEYVGLDVSKTAIDLCVRRFRDDASKSFFLYSPEHFVDHAGVFKADLVLSLDVIFHLVEDDVFERYLHHVFGAARRHVVIYSSNSELPDPAPHVRHREFTSWVATNIGGWRLEEVRINDVPDAVADFFLYSRHSTS